jgi:hypothetical protein
LREFQIVKDGASKINIVTISPKPPEEFAALELQRYLELISGTKLEIKTLCLELPARRITSSQRFIFLSSKKTGFGGIRYDKLSTDDDGFRIERVGHHLLILGSRPRATLFGVYWLLRRFGVTFLAPSFGYYEKLGGAEHIEKRKTLTISEDCYGYQRPAFRWRPRDIGEGGSHSENDIIALIDWMAKTGHNILRCPSHARGVHSNPHRASWDAWRTVAIPEIDQRGLLIQVGQHGYQNFLSTQDYFTDHPDWFGLLGDKRVPAEECVFCTSNPEAMSEFKKNIIQFVKDRPELDIFDLWPPDSVPWCSCSNCLPIGSESERHSQVVVSVREALRKARPNVKLGIIAYQQYTEFPEKTSIPSDVRLDFCPISREYEHRLDDVVSNLNRIEYWQKLLNWHEGWNGEIEIYEYYMKYRFRSIPMIMPRLIAEEHSTYHNLGVNGISSYSEPDTWLAYEISHFLLGICSWKGTVDFDKELNRWATIRTSKTLSRTLLEAISLIEGNLRPLYSGYVGFHSICAIGRLSISKDELQMRLEYLVEAKKMLDKLSADLKDGSRAWVERLSRSLQYAICDFHVQLAWDAGDKGILEKALAEFRESLSGPQENFEGIIHYGERGRRDLASHYDDEEPTPHW